MVIKDYSFTIKAILVPLLYIESNSLGRWVIYKLNQLALSVTIRRLFGMLDEHFGVLVPQLDGCTIRYLLTELELNPFLIINMLLLYPFLQHFELVLQRHTLYRS